MRGEGIMSFLNRIADIVILSVLWCFYSIPIITIGASTAALYHTVIKVIRQDRGYVLQTFHHSFKGNLKSTLLSSIIFLVLLGASGFGCYMFWDATETIFENAYFFFTLISICVITIIMIHTYLCIGRFNLTKNELITVVIRLTTGHLFMNILILCMVVAAAELFLTYPPLLLFIIPSGLFFLISLIEEPMFKKHINFEDDWNTDLIHNEKFPFHKSDSDVENNDEHAE